MMVSAVEDSVTLNEWCVVSKEVRLSVVLCKPYVSVGRKVHVSRHEGHKLILRVPDFISLQLSVATTPSIVRELISRLAIAP